jgi:transglutaminase-like putative cysteine protease
MRTAQVLSVVVCALLAGVAVADPTNGDFEVAGSDGRPSGWRVFGAGEARVEAGKGEGGSRALRLEPRAGDMVNAGVECTNVVSGALFLVECRVRTEKLRGYAGLWLMGVGSGEYVEAQPGLVRGTQGWQKLCASFTPGRGCRGIRIKLGAKGPGRAWFDDVRILRGAAARAALAGRPHVPPGAWGLFHLKGRYRATVQHRRSSHEIVLPLPIVMDGQSPLSFEVTSEPKEVLQGVELEHRGGPNWVARARLAPAAGVGTFRIHLDALVLATERDYTKFDPGVKLSAYRRRSAIPQEPRAWLAASETVQAKNTRIRALARRAARGAKTIGELLEGIRREVHTLRRDYPDRYASEWDAVTTLSHRTGCCGNANLVTALLRASRVPARILAGHPPRSGPHATHYVVEYYVPGFGWVLYEPSSLSGPVHPCGQIEVSQVTPEDEDAGVRRVGVGQPAFWNGTPLYSTPELQDAPDPGRASLRVAGAVPTIGAGSEAATHQVLALRRFRTGAAIEGQLELVRLAAERWAELLAEGNPEGLRTGRAFGEVRSADELETRLKAE